MNLEIKIIIISIFICFSFIAKGQFGKAYISENFSYEYFDNYFPHDNSLIDPDLLDTPLIIKFNNKNLILINSFNSGLCGHNLEIILTEDLTILNAKYYEWTDVIDGSDSKYTVEKVILSLSSNPFYNKNISGYYTIQIRVDVDIGDLLRSEGYKDTTYYRIFHGKFKEYPQKEIENGREWILDNYLKKIGVKDSLNVYTHPDIDSKFRFDFDSIYNYVKCFKIKLKKNVKEYYHALIIKFNIDKKGYVIPESINIETPIEDKEVIIEGLKRNTYFLNNWLPGYYERNAVKTRNYIYIRFDELKY